MHRSVVLLLLSMPEIKFLIMLIVTAGKNRGLVQVGLEGKLLAHLVNADGQNGKRTTTIRQIGNSRRISAPLRTSNGIPEKRHSLITPSVRLDPRLRTARSSCLSRLRSGIKDNSII